MIHHDTPLLAAGRFINRFDAEKGFSIVTKSISLPLIE